MTIKEALKFGRETLHEHSDSAALDAEILLAFVLKKPKEYLAINPEKNLLSSKLITYKKLINKRKNNWPVAYLINSREFYGLNFYVDKNVLIPRPWTESLVLDAAETLKEKSGLKILDVGTGSGAIIISLAKALGGNNEYFASDISKQALKVAQKNARRHEVKINFKHSDLLANWKQEFDIVTANLPYLAKETNSSTKQEPKLALISPHKGLQHYERLFYQLSQWEKHPTLLFVEAEPKQRATLETLAHKLLPHTELRITSDNSAFSK